MGHSPSLFIGRSNRLPVTSPHLLNAGVNGKPFCPPGLFVFTLHRIYRASRPPGNHNHQAKSTLAFRYWLATPTYLLPLSIRNPDWLFTLVIIAPSNVPCVPLPTAGGSPAILECALRRIGRAQRTPRSARPPSAARPGTRAAQGKEHRGGKAFSPARQLLRAQHARMTTDDRRGARELC